MGILERSKLMAERGPVESLQCPLCGGSYEHDPNCPIANVPILIAASLGEERARAEAERRAEMADYGKDQGRAASVQQTSPRKAGN